MGEITQGEVERLWLEVPAEERSEKEAKWADLSPDEKANRRMLSVLARERHKEIDPETGRPRLGGVQPGAGRPSKKKRVAQLIAERAQEPEEAEKIMAALFDRLKSEDERVQLRTVEAITRIEAKDAELQQKQQELDDKPKDEVIRMLAEAVRAAEKSGELGDLLPRRPYDAEATAIEEGTVQVDGD